MQTRKGKSRSFGASARIKKRNVARNNIRRYANLSIRTLIILIIIFAPIMVLRSSFLQIREIKVLPDETVLSEPLKETARDFISGNWLAVFPRSNMFLMDEDDLASVLLSEFPNFEKVDINRRFDKTLEISVKERSFDYLWCDPGMECFSMTRSGLIFDRGFLSKSEPKIIFKGSIVGNPINQKFASIEEMQKYESLISNLKTELDVVSLSREAQNKIVTETSVGDIFFNGEEKDLKEAVESAILLIKDVRGKNPGATFQYVDARFGKKIFYKLN